MYTFEDDLTGEKEFAAIFFPFPEFSAKIGVSENLELGVRWPLGPGMTTTGKYQFLRGPTDGAFSLYGSFYGFTFGGATIFFYGLSPRFIISSEAPNAFPFSANAGISFSGVLAGAEGATASGSTLSAVAGLGLPFRFGATRSFRIMPEFSLTLPIVSTFEAEDVSGSQSLLGNFSISLGFGFTYTGPYER